MIEVYDQDHLEALPDGSIITWLRIPGDETSRAVAFVRVEVEPGQPDTWDGGGRPLHFTPPKRVAWISPGGWAPMTPDDANIHYPVTVVQLGSVHHSTEQQMNAYGNVPMDVAPYVGPLPQLPAEIGTLISGGTYPRDHALECAARALAPASTEWSHANFADVVLALADKFTEWLDAKPADSRLIPTPSPELVDDPDQVPPCGRANCLHNCDVCVAYYDKQVDDAEIDQ